MKICLISTGHDARDDRLYFKEARSLAKEHDVVLMAPSAKGRPAIEDGRLSFIKLNCRSTKVSRALMALRLLFVLPRGRYEVLHLSDAETIPLAPLFRWRCQAKVVCDIWEANYEALLGPSEKPAKSRRLLAALYRWMERAAVRRCDLVLTADEAIASSLSPETRATVIYNFPLLSALQTNQAAVESLRAKYAGTRCLIYHGSMGEDRGVLAGVEAIRLIRTQHPRAKLLLVGQMPDGLNKKVRTLTKELGLEKAVDLIGWVDHSEVGKYLAISEIGLVPFERTRKFEKNIPQKIFEYWAFGLPLVATDLAPIRQFVKQCDGGVLTASNSPLAIAQAVQSLLDRPDAALDMGARGKNWVENIWRWERMEEILLSAYRSLGAKAD